MKVRVTSAFVTRYYEEWARTGDTMLKPGVYSGPTMGEKHQRVERFLEAMAPDLARVLKHQLLEALLAETAASQRVPIESSVLDSIIRD